MQVLLLLLRRRLCCALLSHKQTLVQNKLDLSVCRDKGLRHDIAELLCDCERVDNVQTAVGGVGKDTEGLEAAVIALQRHDINRNTLKLSKVGQRAVVLLCDLGCRTRDIESAETCWTLI